MNSQGSNEATNKRPAKDAGAGRLGRRLGRRLTLGVILFSALVTGVFTVLELYRQYRVGVDEIARQFISINRSMVPALAEAVWVEDPMQIRIILDGLVSLRDVESVTIITEGAKSWSAGARVSKRTLLHSVPLSRSYKGREVAIGRLDIVASLDNVYDRLWNMLLVTLAGNAVNTVLVVIFMIYLFRRLVGRHIQHIASHVIGLASDHTSTLALERTPVEGPWRPDILDEVVAAVNQANDALSAQREQLKSQVAALQESEERFRLVQENSPDGFTILQPTRDALGRVVDFTWVYENATIARLNGTEPKAVVGRGLLEIFPEHRDTPFFRAYQQVAETGKSCVFEADFLREDSTKPISFRIVVVPTGENIAILAQNITERKLAEEETQKITRIYKILSNINQTIVRVHDQQLLFNEACRIAVEDGGFLMAWIGLVNTSKNKVDVVASSGKTTEYLNDINIDLNNERLSSGPTGIAIKSGKGSFSNNIETDDKMIPWREKALKYGYRSSMTLPITVSGKTIGAYTMYAGETDFFNEDEIKLLDEMASDISFALEFIESEYKRKQADDAMRNERIMLSRTEGIAHIGSWRWDIATDTVTWSDELFRIFQRDPQKGAPSFAEHPALYQPDDMARLRQAVEIAIADGTPYELKLRAIRKDGKTRVCVARGFADMGPDGRPNSLFGSLQDITEREQAEELLREREYLLSASQEAAHVGSWSWKVGDTKAYWSDETYRIYGLSPEMGSPSFEFFFEIIHPEDRHKMREWPEALIAGLHPSPVEFRVRRPDGIYRVIRTEGDVIDTVDGVPSRIAGTAYDVTERKEAEELFSSAFHASPVGIIITRIADGKIVDANEAFLDLFEFSYEETIGHTSIELNMLSPEERGRLIQRQLESGGLNNFELLSMTRSGKPVNLLFSSKPLQLRDEACHITTLIDITERKRAEEELKRYQDHLVELVKERTGELEEANLRLQELDRLKSMFIASMSHELRTPLNSIIGFTGIILMGMSGEISAIQKKQLGMVKNSADHLLELINDVIDVSKIEAGRTDLSIEAFDLSDLALQVKESFAVAASDKGLEVEYRTDGRAEVMSDPRRVRQILVNLVGNAVKFTEAGTVSISVFKMGDGAQIKVRDTGIGMCREDMERLFQAFSRIHIQGRPIVEGTGLGLYLSRRIAGLLGGEITAESEPGRGSEFTLSLPRVYLEGGE